MDCMDQMDRLTFAAGHVAMPANCPRVLLRPRTTSGMRSLGPDSIASLLQLTPCQALFCNRSKLVDAPAG